jgi:hypothetical protein
MAIYLPRFSTELTGGILRSPARTSSPEDPPASDASLFERVRGQFNEMPGLSPTLDQMVRLFGLEPDSCRRIVSVLIADGFLRLTSDGRYRMMSRS